MKTQDLFPDLFQNKICEDYDARNIRDEILRRTDWTQLVDADLSEAHKESYRTYRQHLRDISRQKKFPRETDWGEVITKEEVSISKK